MDKTTKGFVIAACSIVIATPIFYLVAQGVDVWLYEADQAEKRRQISRILPCSEHSTRFFGVDLNKTRTDARSKFYRDCVKSTVPVEKFE